MGFTVDVSVPAVTVFLQGLLSFFSPCVLPLLPLYIGYLSGGTGKRGEDGRFYYDRKKVLLHTVFFVLGVSFAFFVLGLGVSAAGRFFKSNQMMFARVGGILVVLFGLYQLGLFGESKVLGTERRLPFRLNVLAMSPLTALLMGFTFSFAWTPCVGPALASVLLMAGSADSGAKGFLLIGVYTIGFILPFLAAGIFTAGLLAWFKKHMKIVKYTVKAGGVLMILMGLLMFTGKMNDITGYLSILSPGTSAEESAGGDSAPDSTKDDAGETGDGSTASDGTASGNGTDEETQKTAAYDFELMDQFGNTHTLADYKGKVIFLNFWATWCGPCRNEMPEIQKLYEEYSSQGEDAEVVILGAAAPDMGQEGSVEEIAAFMEENGYTYPVLMDETWEMFNWYGISAFPTTFMIDRNGNIYGYVQGQLTEDIMRSIIEQTSSGQ